MDKLIPLIPVTVFIVCAALLVFKPEPFMKLFGNIYWHMGKYTALGKSENTKKYFFSENTFWFRALGVIMLIVALVSVLTQTSK